MTLVLNVSRTWHRCIGQSLLCGNVGPLSDFCIDVMMKLLDLEGKFYLEFVN